MTAQAGFTAADPGDLVGPVTKIGRHAAAVSEAEGLDEAAPPRKGGAVCRGWWCWAKHFVQETFPIGFAMRKVLSIGVRSTTAQSQSALYSRLSLRVFNRIFMVRSVSASVTRPADQLLDGSGRRTFLPGLTREAPLCR